MIELLCTLTGIIAGVAVVASLLTYQGDRAKFEVSQPAELEPEKFRGIADQLQVISHSVAANVSTHNQRVQTISGKLSDSPAEDSETVLTSIHEIIRANEAMQGQLADAQKRIAQQTQLIAQAAQQARTDALTGLSNRRALDEYLANCIASYRDDEVVALLLMDIDHFKNFNDSFGHTTGDAVLASFARALSTCCGKSSYTARFGGEEFAVILSGSTMEEVVRAAAEIRYFVSEQIISHEDLQLKITSSGGLCRIIRDDTINTAYERADEGLYQSKSSGRNCGHWLGQDGWAPFPVSEEAPKTLDQLRLEFASDPSKLKTTLPSSVQEVAEAGRKEPAVVAKSIKGEKLEQAATENPTQKIGSEILDLNTFMGRLTQYLDQLRRAELPATALMIEATELKDHAPSEAAASWEAVIGMIQVNLRGIDVVCLFKPFTLCVFLPGCSPEAAMERASKIQHGFNAAKETWSAGPAPSRLAVCLAEAGDNEDASHYINRLERSLEDAQDALANEVVVNDGDTCHFQEV